MCLTIDDLMACVGCLKWPQRWRTLYGAAMEDFEKNGCPYTDPAYYSALAEKYGCLPTELDTYRQAAAEIGRSDALSRLLHLVCTALSQKEFNFSDTASFKLPMPPDAAPWLARDMLPGLALCSQIPRCAQRLRARNLPESVIKRVMEKTEKSVTDFRNRTGVPGYDLLDWNQKLIAGTLFPMGRLELDIFQPFLGDAWVFRSTGGKTAALAHNLPVHRSGMALGARHFEDPEGSWIADVRETEAYWEGYPFDEKGFVQKQPLRLDKARWKKVLAKGDPVVQLHIPSSGRLTEASVTKSLAQMVEFLSTYYTDYHYKAFACSSWLLDPVLEELLGQDSNIVRFSKRFRPLTRKIHGTSSLFFVFGISGTEADLSGLPENSRLEKALKQHYLAGKAVYEVNGYML